MDDTINSTKVISDLRYELLKSTEEVVKLKESIIRKNDLIIEMNKCFIEIEKLKGRLIDRCHEFIQKDDALSSERQNGLMNLLIDTIRSLDNITTVFLKSHETYEKE